MNINRNEITRLAGLVGLAMVIAGYARHLIQNIWGTFNITLLVAGGVLLLAGLVFNYKDIINYFSGRTAKLGANTAVLTLAVLAILSVINIFGFYKHKRFDVTAEQINSLSDQTRRIVSGLPKDVKVIKFAKTEDPVLRDRMREFRDLSKRISYEFVDPELRPEVAQEYKLQGQQSLVTIVSSGTRTERLTTTDEQSLVNAIIKVTRDKLKTICFVEGHDEKPLNGSDADGLSTVERVLKNENYETKQINLISTSNQVPAECAVLVIAGPKKGFLPQETAAIGKYLDGSGKVFLMIDPDTDPQLGELLKTWNIEVGNNTVIDTSAAAQLSGFGAGAPVVRSYAQHPITKEMMRVATLFPRVRSVKAGSAAKGDLSITEILKTSENSWAETELKGNEAKFDEGKDIKGPISICVAASRTVGDNEARLVVIGDSDFATNARIPFVGNGDLFFNTINWLAQDEDLISIRPKSATNRSITLTESQQRNILVLTILLMPLAVIGMGTYIWWKRR